jgi:succinate-semialdehyde dehydrogenase/glutarate-semialdehyde dehydrogenase
VSPDGKSRLLVAKKPVGPCLLITPWNFPLAMATRKIAPAVAAGCTMVLKSANLTPLTSQLFAAVMQEAGLPAGVLNVIPTSTAGATTGPLIKDSRLRKLSFTGSTEVGRRLLADASENVLRTSMELGGNAPFLVFEDADLDAAVTGAMAAKLRNMGEACTAANRFIVHESVAAEFAEKFAAKMKEMTTARGTEPESKVGPLIDGKSRDKVHELVSDALASGAKAVLGGAPVEGPGYFYQPTILSGVSEGTRILSEEIFGPVAPIITFSSEDEAVRLANNTEYGLVAYVFTKDINRGIRMGERLETGMLGLNAGVISNAAAPFGGVKQSGLGREGGLEGIEEYLYTQYIGIADPYAG